jgi:multiple sugar transport system permease protein
LSVERKKVKDKATSFLFLIPYLVTFVLFMGFPVIYGLWISLHKWNLLEPDHPFIGLKNYTDLFNPNTPVNDPFVTGIINTFQFVVYSVPFLILCGLGLALLVNALPRRLKPVMRTIYFLPTAVSVSVVSVIWLWIFDANSGLLNYYLKKLLGISPIPWLTSLPQAWFAIVLTTLWWTVGFNMIIFLAALGEIPEELYEAASIDGAGRWTKFIHITLPQIKNISLFVLITSTISSFNIFGQPLLMTRGGPGESTQVLLISIYNEAFHSLDVGSAASMAVVLALIMLVISALQFILFREKKPRGSKGETTA